MSRVACSVDLPFLIKMMGASQSMSVSAGGAKVFPIRKNALWHPLLLKAMYTLHTKGGKSMSTLNEKCSESLSRKNPYI